MLRGKKPTAKPKTSTKLQLTTEIQSLVFQCLNDEQIEMDHQKKLLVASIAMALFPELKKQAKQGMVTKPRRSGNILYYVIGAALILVLTVLLIGKYSG